MLGLELADQRLVSGRLTTRWGQYFDGKRVQQNADLIIRPTRHLGLGVQYTQNRIHLPAGDFTTRLFGLQSRIAFTNTLSWSTLLQYDNVSELMGINSRLHWIPEAGKQVFLVLNYGLADMDGDNRFHAVNADLSLKMNYTLRY
jgi:hypothetical protein